MKERRKKKKKREGEIEKEKGKRGMLKILGISKSRKIERVPVHVPELK